MKSLIQKRILIVDDDLATVNTLFTALSVNGDFIIDKAEKSATARTLLNKYRYDVVITDYKMPGLTGIDLGRMIRRQSPSTRIILMTAYDLGSIKRSVDEVNFDGIWQKPIPIRDIRETVVKVLTEVRKHRTGELVPTTALVRDPLIDLQMSTNAYCALLLRSEGFLMSMAGSRGTFDVNAISALIAANFMAAAELARLLGNESVFKSSYHEGPKYDIYALAVDKDHLLAIVFGNKGKAGMVRYFAQKTASILERILREQSLQNLPQQVHVTSDDIDKSLEDLFSQ